MKITILNGNAKPDNQGFDDYITQLTAALEAERHSVTVFTLRDLDIKACIGCFGCWVKTPGRCVVEDDSHKVCQGVINSDFVLWAAPLRLGFPDAHLKKMLDKSISLVHPYIIVDHGEAHHLARYEHYPRLGLLMEKEIDTDAEDLRIVTDILSRTALNLKSCLEFAACTDQPVVEVARNITNQNAAKELFEHTLGPLPGTRITPPTQLVVFNGSPRGKKGNTPLMLSHVIKGFTSKEGCNAETFHLVRQHDLEQYRDAFTGTEAVLLGFPLYTDAMPGIVKAFIEALEPLRGRSGNPALGFLVQSGFPEPTHIRHIERYLAKLATRLGSPYLGTIVKGGGEGLTMMPEERNLELFTQLSNLGKSLAEEGQFDTEALKALTKWERFPAYLILLFKILSKTPLLNLYWNQQLKKNGVYKERSAQPYTSQGNLS